MRRWAIALVALLAAATSALAAPAAAQAQAARTDQAADTLRLTLDEALRIARGTNPAYRQAVNETSLSPIEMRTTWLDEVFPRASLNLFNTSFYGNVRRSSQDNFGNPIENPSADWVYFSDTNQSLTLDWSIQGTSMFNALRRQRLTNRGRTLAESRALSELEVAVERDFWNAVEQEELRRAEEELLAARELDHQVADRLFGLAMRTRVDVLRAELAVEQQRLALRQQAAALEQAKLALRTRLGNPDLPPFAAVAEPLPVFDPTGLDADALTRRAADVNPALLQADVAVESARVDVQDSNRAWWPNLFAQYNLTRRAQTPAGRALFDLSFNESLDHRFFIGLQIPMFGSYFQNRQTMAQAAVRLENEGEAAREMRLEVRETVESALLELESQWETLRLTERAGQIATQALELAREEYRLGTSTFEALRQSTDEEAETRRQLIQARYAFMDALLDLEEAVGARVRD